LAGFDREGVGSRRKRREPNARGDPDNTIGRSSRVDDSPFLFAAFVDAAGAARTEQKAPTVSPR
jgi:hypothetical protein